MPDGEEAKPVEEKQIVAFNLGKEEYAVEIGQAREIVKTPDITIIPNAPGFIRGIINLRGKIVVVIDLAERFNIEREKKPSNIIIAETGDRNFGLLVDDVTEIIRIDRALVKNAPGMISGKIHADYIDGVAVLGERVIVLLDLQKILSEKELEALAKEEIKAKEQAGNRAG